MEGRASRSGRHHRATLEFKPLLCSTLVLLTAPVPGATDAVLPQAPIASAQSWRDAAVASFDVAWQTIDETYYDPTFGGLDWAGIRRELRPSVERAASPDAARDVLRQMLGRLGQSHFAVLPGAASRDARPGDAAVPIDVRVDASQAIVITRVEPDSSASRAGVRAGDRLLAVDDERADQWVARAKDVSARLRVLEIWRQAFRALHGASRSSARLEIQSPDGAARAVDVARAAPPGQPVTLGNLPPLPVRTDIRAARTPGGKDVGVIAFNLWMPLINVPIADGVDRFRDAPGLVFDLRGNTGGLADMMRGIAGHVLNEPVVLGRMQTRPAALEFKANPRRSRPDGRTVEPYAGPVAILVDELTGSTSECFTGALQDLGRARVFGRQTMGQALPAVTKLLPNGDTLMYVLGDFVTSSGRRLEGAGVLPDQVVPLDVRALAAGRDPVLDAALRWIDRQPGGSR
jgi:carboxyl-terminal processing protease